MPDFPMHRRALLGAGLAAPFIASQSLRAQLPFSDYPFTLGLAAGDPAPDGFVIWTRLAPQPLEPHGGMPMAGVSVGWDVAEDDRFARIVAKGEALARPEVGHSVHVEVTGLQPGRPYWYRFRCGTERTYAGTARTLPTPGTTVDRVRFASAGCQHYEAGFYTAHRHLAAEELDFVYFSGDYIYEYSSGYALDDARRPIEKVRNHIGREPISLDDYRRRYAQTRLDADLQSAHAAHAWFASYDDHEVKNNWVGAIDEDPNDPAVFLLRRAAAIQAWYEHMPVRRRSLPVGDRADIVRRAEWGTLLRGHFCDTRLFRTDQPCEDGFKPACPGVTAKESSVLGTAQERWLLGGLDAKPRWNLLAQQIMMMPLDRRRDADRQTEPVYNLDSWAGYTPPRERILDHIASRRLGNVVVITGDEHQNFAGEVRRGTIGEGPAAAVEFVGTSISSGGDGQDVRTGNARMMTNNPGLKFTNDQRGYILCDVTNDQWRTSFRTLPEVSAKGAPITTRATFVVEHGRPTVAAA